VSLRCPTCGEEVTEITTAAAPGFRLDRPQAIEPMRAHAEPCGHRVEMITEIGGRRLIAPS